jgi:hypothetical protein
MWIPAPKAPGFFFNLTKIFTSMLRFIALTVIAYFIFKWLDGFFGPKKSQPKRTSNTAQKKSSFSKNVGEYVDYEEVTEDKR